MRQSKYTKLNDKNWLVQKYCVEKLSTVEIGKIVGVKTCNSVRQSLIRFGIDVRNLSESLLDKKEDYFIFNNDVIYGSLLGDGSLRKHNKNEEAISAAAFHKKNIHYDHMEFVAKQIFTKHWEDRIKKSGNWAEYKGEQKYHEYFVLRTLAKNDLNPIYKEWYPKDNNYKKLIPESLEPTPGVLLNMFLDDGCSYHRRKESNVKQIVLSICSQSFTRDNQEMFCEKVNNKFNLGMKTTSTNSGTGFLIRVPQSKVGDFYNIIGPPPFESLAYKWK